MLKIVVETMDGEGSEFDIRPKIDSWTTHQRILTIRIDRASYNFPFETLKCFTIEPSDNGKGE